MRELLTGLVLEASAEPGALGGPVRWAPRPGAPAVLSGNWIAVAPGHSGPAVSFLLRTRSGGDAGHVATLDGYLDRTGGVAGGWTLTAVYAGTGGARILLARIRQRLAVWQGPPGRPDDQADRAAPDHDPSPSYAVTIRPAIDGAECPELTGLVSFPRLQGSAMPGFFLSSDSDLPGAPGWFAGGPNDADVVIGDGVAQVTVGPQHADGQLPTWLMAPDWGSGPDPDLCLPYRAEEGSADLVLRGGRISGTVWLHGRWQPGFGGPHGYRAEIAGALAGAADKPGPGQSASPADHDDPTSRLLDALWPEFDVTLRCEDGFPGHPALPAVLDVAPRDLAHRVFGFTLATITPEVRPGFLRWSADRLATSGHLSAGRLTVTSGGPDAGAGLPGWWASETEPIAASHARLDLRYDADAHAIAGTLAVTDDRGRIFRARLDGVLRSRAAERLRARLRMPAIGGRWRGLIGPFPELGLPLPGPGRGPADFEILAGAATDPPTGGQSRADGFLRLATGPDLAIGLARGTTAADRLAGDRYRLLLLSRVGGPASVTAAGAMGASQRQALRSLGESLVRAGRYAEARVLLGRAARLHACAAAQAESQSRTRTELISAIATVGAQATCALALRDYEGLLRVLADNVGYQRMLSALGAAAPGAVHAGAVHAGAVHAGAADIGEASRGARALSGFVDTWRSRLADDADRIEAATASMPFFDLLVSFLAGLGATEDALVASEAGRARAFSDLLASRSTGGEKPGRRSIRVTAPRFTQPALRAVLAEHQQTVVEYFIHADTMLTWVVRPDGTVRMSEGPPGGPARLRRAAERYRGLTRERTHGRAGCRALDDVLRELGELLWDQVADAGLPADPDEVVTVVPHAEAMAVPFPALRDRHGRYLAERHAIALLPALAILPELRRRRPGPERAARLLALVDPSPLPPNPLAAGRPFGRTGLASGFSAIAAMYDAADVLTGAQASAPALTAAGQLEQGRQPTVVQLGTHAVAFDGSEGDPLDSFVALARTGPGDGERPGADGRLRARDILASRMPGDVVVLAACATGAGKITGDGVVGLSRAFLASGPATLVLTLSAVENDSCLELTAEFHRQLRLLRRSPAQALAGAQRELIGLGEPARSWSPFVVYGIG